MYQHDKQVISSLQPSLTPSHRYERFQQIHGRDGGWLNTAAAVASILADVVGVGGTALDGGSGEAKLSSGEDCAVDVAVAVAARSC